MIHTNFLALLFSCANAELAPAPDASLSPATVARTTLERVIYDEPGDGHLWALGATFKASFGPSGATYVPFFGSQAPRNWPVLLRLASVEVGGEPVPFAAAVQAQRSDDNISIRRGNLVEMYALTPTAVEQSFVFEDLPRTGDLVIRIRIESELTPRADEHGLVLSNEHGHVRYGLAEVFDARARRAPAPLRLEGDVIEIRVPATFLSQAQFPLTVDPVISTFSVDVSAADVSHPDIAYALTSNVHLDVWEHAFSAIDHDVLARALDANGAPIVGGDTVIDATTTYWARPAVASNRAADQFLVVAELGNPSGLARVIRGRTRLASTSTAGAQIVISGALVGDHVHPDVGGDPSGAATSSYCVTWERVITPSEHDIHARLVDTSGMALGASSIGLDVSVGTNDAIPSISKSCGNPPSATMAWNVVWQRENAPTDHDIRGAQIRPDGTIGIAAFTLDSTGNDDTQPSVSSLLDGATGARAWLVVYERPISGTHTDIVGRLMLGSTSVAYVDLSGIEGSITVFQDQLRPAVDSDGFCFALSYAEEVGTSGGFDVYVATFSVASSQLYLSEAHQRLASSTGIEDRPQLTSQRSSGGPGGRFAITWENATGGVTLGDIEGGLYEAGDFTAMCGPGWASVTPCPCGNPPIVILRGCDNSAATGGAWLVASGTTSPDTVLLQANDMLPTSLCIFLQGDALIPTPSGVAFGDGIRCLGGQLLRLATKNASGGAASYPVGVELSITAQSAALGFPIAPASTRYYQTYYRDPAAFACPSPATFNITQGAMVRW